MRKMIVPTDNYFENIRLFKCKRCKNEFGIIWNSEYVKTVCFCPSCGQSAFKQTHRNEIEEENES